MATLFVVDEYDSKMSAIIGTGSRALRFCIVRHVQRRSEVVYRLSFLKCLCSIKLHFRFSQRC